MSEERDVFELNVPRSRPLTPDDFRKLMDRLRDVYRCLVSTHQCFAHLIKMEERRDCLRVAFFALDEDIPETLVIITDREFRFVHCLNGERTDITDLDSGVFRVVNLIRLTAQVPILRASHEVAELMAGLHVRSSRSSPNASNAPCVHA